MKRNVYVVTFDPKEHIEVPINGYQRSFTEQNEQKLIVLDRSEVMSFNPEDGFNPNEESRHIIVFYPMKREETIIKSDPGYLTFCKSNNDALECHEILHKLREYAETHEDHFFDEAMEKFIRDDNGCGNLRELDEALGSFKRANRTFSLFDNTYKRINSCKSVNNITFATVSVDGPTTYTVDAFVRAAKGDLTKIISVHSTTGLVYREVLGGYTAYYVKTEMDADYAIDRLKSNKKDNAIIFVNPYAQHLGYRIYNEYDDPSDIFFDPNKVSCREKMVADLYDKEDTKK